MFPTPRKTYIRICGLVTALLLIKGQYAFAQDTSVKSDIKPLSLPGFQFQIPKASLPKVKDSSLFHLPKFSKPFFNLNHGRVDYTYYYRSNIDTPLIQQNVYQHQLYITNGFTLGNLIPLTFSGLFRRSNSILFRDLNDVQVAFDLPKFQRQIYDAALKNIYAQATSLKDTLAGRMSELKSIEHFSLKHQFDQTFNTQKLVEAKELINYPSLSWDKSLPDSLARSKSDSLINSARRFINLYETQKEKLKAVKNTADSFQHIYETSLAKVRKIQSLATGSINNFKQYKTLINDPIVKESGINLIPSKYKWLLGIKKMAIGRSPVNYSELTAKNLSLNGFNFEYNSWYYAAVCAGLVDYRFRDFVINSPQKNKQFFYMVRLGLGRLEHNYLIASFYKGNKQIYTSGNIANLYSVNTTGVSLEAQYRLTRNIYIKGEIAESIAPDFRNSPPKNNQWNLTDRNDKAWSLSSSISLPKAQLYFNGMYKYTGANFQSFSSFQTNSSLSTWNVKADKYFFRKQLRINAALRSNEFSNPYLLQQYQSNVIFKTVQATFRRKGWPVLSGGFMPMSQLTNIGGLVIENRFNTLNSTLFYNYPLAEIKAATTASYSKFYNTTADTGFLYFNARNIFVSQLLYFHAFTAGINITHSANRNYEFNVMDENIQFSFRRVGKILFGVKVNSLNRKYQSIGSYANLQLTFVKDALITLVYEDGFIPGINGTLVKNTIGSIQLSRRF